MKFPNPTARVMEVSMMRSGTTATSVVYVKDAARVIP